MDLDLKTVAYNRNVALLPCHMQHFNAREYLLGRNGPGAQRGLCAVQSVRAGIQVPQGRHNEKLPEWELHPVGGTLIRVAAGRESGSAMLCVLNVSIDTKAVDIYAPPAK